MKCYNAVLSDGIMMVQLKYNLTQLDLLIENQSMLAI